MIRTRPAVLAALLSACAADPEGEDSAVALGCEVGTGEEGFESLEEGEEVSIIAGPQGGYHITTAARATGVEGETVLVTGTLRLAATGEYLGPGFSLAWPYEAVDGKVEATGLLNLLNDPEQARDQEVILSVGVEDDTGAEAWDERIVVAR